MSLSKYIQSPELLENIKEKTTAELRAQVLHRGNSGTAKIRMRRI